MMKKLLSLLLLCVLLCPAAMADTLLTMDTTKVPAIPEGTFSDYQESRREKGTRTEQAKPVRVLSTKEQIAFFESARRRER